MRRATVSDVMTREVVTFRPDTPFIDIIRTLSEHNISGAPVIGPCAFPSIPMSTSFLIASAPYCFASCLDGSH